MHTLVLTSNSTYLDRFTAFNQIFLWFVSSQQECQPFLWRNLIFLYALNTWYNVQPFKNRLKNFEESLALFDLSAVYVTALYNEYENSKYKLFIIRLLIITVLAYFIVLISCHCIMLMCGDTIKRRAYKTKQVLMKRSQGSKWIN